MTLCGSFSLIILLFFFLSFYLDYVFSRNTKNNPPFKMQNNCSENIWSNLGETLIIKDKEKWDEEDV